MLTTVVIVTFAGITLMVLAAIVLSARKAARSQQRLDDSRAVKAPPPSLRPTVDPSICIGSAACVDACPEEVLAQVDGLPHIVEPGNCVGHGACREACPVSAIALRMGSAQRGVDLPVLRRGYQSSVDGIYVAGELGGMGLIRNAFRQGLGAIDAIASSLPERRRQGEVVDVLIVGAGPAGIACALQAAHRGLSYLVVEQWSVGGSVSHFPRRKVVMTETFDLPIVGQFGRREMVKEELVEQLTGALEAAGADVLDGRRLSGISGKLGEFTATVETAGGRETHRARSIVLCIGRRGTPRKLGVPGEDEYSHVVYMLRDAEQYRRRRVMVVGGGDSAVEAALQLSEVVGTHVCLSYRGDAFTRCKKANRERIQDAAKAKRVEVHLATNVTRITPEVVELKGAVGRYSIPTDDVIVSIGAELPIPFLTSLGIAVEEKRGEELARDDASERAKALARASERLLRFASGRHPKTQRQQ